MLLHSMLLVFVLVIAGCGYGDESGIPAHVRSLDNLVIPDPEETPYRVHFDREVVYSDSLLLDRITAVTTDEEQNLYTAGASWKRTEVFKFSNEGEFLRSIGSFGTDEGQFISIDAITVLDNTLYVFDRVPGRKTVIPLASEEKVSISEPGMDTFSEWISGDSESMRSSPVWITGSGDIITEVRQVLNPAYFPERKLRYLRSSHDFQDPVLLAELRDTLFLVGDYAGRPAPFTLRYPQHSLIAFFDDGSFATAWNDEFLVKVYDDEGSYKRAIYYDWQRAELDRESVIHPAFSHNDQLLRIRESAEYPAHWPAVISLLTDNENRIWIALKTDDDTRHEWWVVNAGGLLARFQWPAGSAIRHIRNGSLYAVEDDNTGFKDVVRYRFSFEQAVEPVTGISP
jgi:hypothetical protein